MSAIMPILPNAMQQALAAHERRDWAKAEQLCQAVLEVQPGHFDALHLLGVLAARSGRAAQAAELFSRAIAANPANAAAHGNFGTALRHLQRFDEALASFDAALKLNPNLASAHVNRGITLAELKRLDAAVESFSKAIELKPEFAEAHYNLGRTLEQLGRLDAAVQSYDRAIVLKPGYAEAYSNRGNALSELKQVAAALESFDQAIALRADYVSAHVNKAQTLLLSGDFARGWESYEWRWRKQAADFADRRRQQPLWLGNESIAGRTILLYAEQGLGDTIQFCRYARSVANLGARVLLEVQPPLLTLLATLDGVSQVLPRGSALPPFDCQCPLMSLPLALRTELSSVPAAFAYLKADPAKKRHWAERLGERKELRVGLVWAGGFRPNQPETWATNERRNIDLSRLAQLRDVRVRFYSLQKGPQAESELAKLKAAQWGGPDIVDYASELSDFSDTAALADNLDLVISVDTSTAHLVGALGKPVWILNRFDTCWRWMLDREDSPWYPTATLYRQQRPGDWDGVLARVKGDLERLANARDKGQSLP